MFPFPGLQTDLQHTGLTAHLEWKPVLPGVRLAMNDAAERANPTRSGSLSYLVCVPPLMTLLYARVPAKSSEYGHYTGGFAPLGAAL